MNELLMGTILWTLIVAIISILLYTTRKSDEEKRALIPPVMIVMTMGYFLGWAISKNNPPLAFAVFIVGFVLMKLYSDHLRKKGYILEDERTLRIEEIAARRTLQVVLIGLSLTLVYLSIASTKRPELKSAFVLTGVLLAAIAVIHISLRHYYSRVM
jgi:uncharacterized membrane protein